MTQLNKISARGQWLALNRIAYSYKVICFSLTGCLLFTLSILAYVATLPPVVIEKTGENIERFTSTRKTADISKNEIKKFVTTFIKANYEWEKLDKKIMLNNIHPFVTDDFLNLIKRKTKKKSKPVPEYRQYVGNIKVSVTDKEVVSQFDRIIRLKGVPFISVTQISLQIIKDTPNKWNPLGLYVNGLIEHEVK
ncbi:MAG: hypothetical protein CME70_10970 [Halobacteriovorax sp.]|nr:hypothetical protein [Halobacteriovorax sp.]|tara:strand:+ start:33280 stop:33861 length:582 start_codon:yes stop_codon:yes gene_type:complete